MTPDQLTTLSLFCSVALLAVQACFVWRVRQELQTLRHQRATAKDLRKLHADILVQREHGDAELPDNFPREFAAKTAEVRKLAERQEAINKQVMQQIAGPQKSPSSVPAIQAQMKQSTAEINEAKFQAYQSAVMDALGRKA